MKSKSLLTLVLTLSLITGLLASCASGSTTLNPPTQSNNWDSALWNQSTWQ